MSNKPRPFHVKILSSALIAALILTAPGPFAAQALATVIKAKIAPVSAVPPVAGSASVGSNAGVLTLPALSFSQSITPNLSGLNGIELSRPSAQFAYSAHADAAATALSAQPASKETSAAPSVSPSARAIIQGREEKGGKPSVKQTLSAGAAKIQKAKGSSGRFGALKSFFSGSRNRAGETPGVFAHSDGITATPAGFGLSALTLKDLETVAADSSKDFKERERAVKAIAQRGDAAAKDALIAVSQANPEGNAQDYEIHRAALRALAETFDDLRSLRPVSVSHAQEILKKLENDKPEEAFFDYDDTLAEFNTPVSKEIGEGLKAAADAGVEPIILTDRPDVRKRENDVTITDSLKPLTLEQKRALTLVSSRGTRALLYDKKGEAVLVHENPVRWDEAQRKAILLSREAFLESYGNKSDGTPTAEQEYNGKTYELSDYGYAHFLPIGWDIAQVKEAAARLQKELQKRGVDFEVTGRTAKKETDPPYLFFSKIDKRTGVLPLRANRRAIEMGKDALRFGLSGKFAKAAWKIADRVGKRPVEAKKVLSVGDQFFDTRTADIGFAKASPGSMIISVGAAADPRLDDVVVWPKEGAEGSLEILTALGKQAPSEMNKKAVFGLFTQRSASIGAFIVGSIAYPFVAVPIVGWAGYGALMAFGPLAAIATGPLNGLIVDRLSARDAMVVNTAVRIALALVLPVFAALGILNFWTLFIASMANGWLMSSIMTTEGAYIKRLAGGANVGWVNGLAWMNYLAIQVVMGSIIGIGALVDVFDPLWAFYLSAIVHLVVVLPIIWKTMPNISPSPKTIVKMNARLAKARIEMTKASGEKLDALKREEKDLEKALEIRREFLAEQIRTADAAIVKNNAELKRLRSLKGDTWSARREISAAIRAAEADNSLQNNAAESAKTELSETKKSMIESAVKFAKENIVPLSVFSAAAGLYVFMGSGLPLVAAIAAALPAVATKFLGSTVPIIGALVFWISRTVSFKSIWYGQGAEQSPQQKALEEKLAANERALENGIGDAEALKAENKQLRKEIKVWRGRLKTAMLAIALTALLMYPLQYFGLPNMAQILVGAEAKGLLLGQFLGSLFLGNLLANAAKARMPEFRLPGFGRMAGQIPIQIAVAGLTAAWVFTGVIPAAWIAAVWPAAAAVVATIAGSLGLMKLASRITDLGWVQMFGPGFAGAIGIIYLAWATPFLPIPVSLAIMLSLLIIGMVNGPSYVALISYFHRSVNKEKMGAAVGVQGSIFNAAVSLGYGLIALGASLVSPAFPGLLAALGIAYIIGGAFLYFAPNKLPGFPKTRLYPKENK